MLEQSQVSSSTYLSSCSSSISSSALSTSFCSTASQKTQHDKIKYPNSTNLSTSKLQQNNDQQHSEFILNGLQVLKTNNILCDVTLIAENKRFQVHKILLASVSDYFRSMFTSGMKESSQSDIELKGVSSKGLEKVIEIIYTSQTIFETYTDIFDVISAANHLQCLLVIDYCEKNFLSRLTYSNFNYFIQMAKLYRMPNALKQIDLFIVNNLAQIINQTSSSNCSMKNIKRCKLLTTSENSASNQIDNGEFLNVDNLDDSELPLVAGLRCLSYEQMLSCLKHDQLKMREIDLFILTWKWINECLLVSNSNNNHDLGQTVRRNENNSNSEIRVQTIRKNKKIGSKKQKSRLSICSSNKKRISKFSKSDLDLNQKFKTEHHYMRKIDIIRSLLKQIRFALISPMDIINRVQTINNLMIDDKYLRKLVLNALNYHLMPNIYEQQHQQHQQKFSSYTNSKHHEQQLFSHIVGDQDIDNEPCFNLNIRCPVRSVLTIGGREINPYPSLHDTCHLLNDAYTTSSSSSSSPMLGPNFSKTNASIRKLTLTTLPCALSHMQCIVVGNFLYVIGGCVSQCAHGESAVSTTYRYDPRLAKWSNTAPMLEKRAYFFACSLNLASNGDKKGKELIIAFGGKNRDGALSTVEKYDIVSNQWTFAQPLPSSYYAHSGVSHNNLAYLSGGYTQGHFTPDLHSYSLITDQWEELRPMNAARGWHSMCVANENLYVFGGCYLANTTISNIGGLTPNQQQQQQQQQQMAQPVSVTEFYSPSTDQWTIVKPMINLHKEASHFRLGSYVYIFGGYNIATKTGQKLMSRYDIVNDLWHTIGQVSSGMTGIGCCTLDLPWYMFENDECNEAVLAVQSNDQGSTIGVENNQNMIGVNANLEGLEDDQSEIEDDDEEENQYSSSGSSSCSGQLSEDEISERISLRKKYDGKNRRNKDSIENLVQ